MYGPTCIFWANLTPFSLQDFEMWVKSDDPTPAPGSCAASGKAGVQTISPPGMEPFQARCDAEGFMKALQIHTKPYAPSAAAIGDGIITECDPGPGRYRVGPKLRDLAQFFD